MKPVRKAWDQLATRYGALSLRERRLVAVAAVLGPLLIGNLLVVDPQSARIKNLRRSVSQQQTELAEIKGQVAGLETQLQIDPDAAKKAELASKLKQLAGAEERLNQVKDALVAPQDMNRFLERVLAKHAGLRLVSLKTLSPESVVGAPSAGDGKAPSSARQFDLYRHGVTLQLEGTYLDLMAYVDQLEKADRKILWGPLQFSVVEYPKSQLSLTVYTLGTDKAWLAI